MNVEECAKLLGETLAKDERVVRFLAAKTAFESDEALQGDIREYNMQRMALGQEYAKDNAMQDGELIDTLRRRVDELYDRVMNAPAYVAFSAEQTALNTLMQQVNSDINFYAFGERPCTHDCSSCGADCASKK